MTAELDRCGGVVDLVRQDGQLVVGEKCSFLGCDARYDVTYFCLFVEFFVLQWSVRPRVTAFLLSLLNPFYTIQPVVKPVVKPAVIPVVKRV